jgi:hypothetical protein
MPYEVKSGPNRPAFAPFYEEGVLPMNGKTKKENQPRVCLWNPTQPEYGPMLHVRVNWYTLRAPHVCPEDATCHWCRETRQWNKRQILHCPRCKKDKPRTKFRVNPAYAGGRSPHCLLCVRREKMAENKRQRAFVASPTKKCTRCTMVKTKDQFNKEARKTDGYNSWCKDCLSAYKRERA